MSHGIAVNGRMYGQMAGLPTRKHAGLHLLLLVEAQLQ